MNERLCFIPRRHIVFRDLEQIERHTFVAAIKPSVFFEHDAPAIVVERHVFERPREPFGPSVVKVLTEHGLFWVYETDLKWTET
jgi:hypothetical protein